MNKINILLSEINKKYSNNKNILDLVAKASNKIRRDNSSLRINIDELNSLFDPEKYSFERVKINNVGIKLDE
jgi:hypothetical protein